MLLATVIVVSSARCRGDCGEEHKVEFEYKGGHGSGDVTIGKEVEIEFKKTEYVYGVGVETHVIPKWIDVYTKEYGMVKRLSFNDGITDNDDNGNVKEICFDKMKPVVTKGMRFVVSNNDMLVIKGIHVYTRKYQFAVVSYVSSGGHVRCLYMNHSENEIDSDDCGLLSADVNVSPYDMLFIVDTGVNELRNYDNTKVVSLRQSNCTVHSDSTILCVDDSANNSLRTYNVHPVNISHLHSDNVNVTFVYRNYTAEIKQLQLYLSKFSYIYKTFLTVIGYYVNSINKYKRKSQAMMSKIHSIANPTRGTKLFPISSCDELYHRNNGWYYFNINDVNVQLYCDFTSVADKPTSIYIGSVNDKFANITEQCSALNMTPLGIRNAQMINTIVNEILISKAAHFSMEEHVDVLLMNAFMSSDTDERTMRGIIRTRRGKYLLTDIDDNSLNHTRIRYILCTATL